MVFAAQADPEWGAVLFVMITIGGGMPLMIAGELLSDWYLGLEYRFTWWLRRKRIQGKMDKLTIKSRYEMPAYDTTQRIMQHGFNKGMRREGRRTYP